MARENFNKDSELWMIVRSRLEAELQGPGVGAKSMEYFEIDSFKNHEMNLRKD